MSSPSTSAGRPVASRLAVAVRSGWLGPVRRQAGVVVVMVTVSVLVQALPRAAYATVLAAADGNGNENNDAGVLGPLNPADGHGNRLDQYEITGDEGGALNFGRKVMLFLTQGLFALTRWIVGLASWLVDWVLHFEIADLLLDPVRQLVAVLEQHLIVGIGLGTALLTLAAAVCGWWILRGQQSRGLSEFVVTLLIFAIAAVWVANPATAVFGANGLLNQTRDLSLEVASLVTTDGEDTGGGDDRVSKQTRGLFIDVFVRAPHQLINYGTVLEGGPDGDHRCLDTYEEILADAPDYEQGQPWERMANCSEELAAFNEKPTWDRLGAALLAVVAAAFVTILAIVIVLTLLVAQLWLVFETIRLLFALVIGLVPGPGRRQLWKAFGGLAAALSAVVATVVFLALYVVLVRGLLAATDNQSLFVRFLLLDVAIFAGLAWYRQLIAAARAASVRITSRLGTGSSYRAQGRAEPPRARPVIDRSSDQMRQVTSAPGRAVGAVRDRTAGVRQWAAPAQDGESVGRVRGWYQKLAHPGLVQDAWTGTRNAASNPAGATSTANASGDGSSGSPAGTNAPAARAAAGEPGASHGHRTTTSTAGDRRARADGRGRSAGEPNPGRTSRRGGAGERAANGTDPRGYPQDRPGRRRARIDRHRRRVSQQVVWQVATRAGATAATGGAATAALAAGSAATRAQRLARTRRIADRNRQRLASRQQPGSQSSSQPVVRGRSKPPHPGSDRTPPG